MSTHMTATQNTTTPAIKIEVPNFGNGRFAGEMQNFWEQSQKLFGLTPAQAEKFARQAASDAGAILANATATIKIGKMNKDGKASISDASKVKSASLTNALALVRAIQWAGDAGPNGLSYGKTKWTLVEPLQQYVAGLIAE